MSPPDDQPWLTEAANRVRKPTSAATNPVVMLDRLLADREAVTRSMLSDLPMLTPAQIDSYRDDRLIPLARQVSIMGPQLVWVIAPIEAIKQAMLNGWVDPSRRYDKATDSYKSIRPITFGQPGETEESVAYIAVYPNEPKSARVDDLAKSLTDSDENITNGIAQRATELMVNDWYEFIIENALGDLPNREDQIWLKTGLAGALATKYTAALYGTPTSSFLPNLAKNPHTDPIVPDSIDLLHPARTGELRPELVHAYTLARHMKAAVILSHWLERAGGNQIAPLIEAVKATHPAQGESLVKVVTKSSGINLSGDLASK